MATFSIPSSGNTMHEYLTMIKGAEVDGYPKRVDVAGTVNEYRFRLHRQFSPNFDVSYRISGVAVIPIPLHFLKLLKERSVNDPKVWAQGVYREWLKSRPGYSDQIQFDGMNE